MNQNDKRKEMEETMTPIHKLLRALMPNALSVADALSHHEDDIVFIASQALLYLEGCDDTRADILAFHESDGVSKVHEAHEKIDNGTPTTEDLKGWLNEEA